MLPLHFASAPSVMFKPVFVAEQLREMKEGKQEHLFFSYSCLKFILEMYSCCIFESLQKYVWPPNPSPLLRSVNKPTVQLSAPSCPLLHTIYLFTGVATLLTLFLLSFPLFKSSLLHRVFHAK